MWESSKNVASSLARLTSSIFIIIAFIDYFLGKYEYGLLELPGI